jgi:hypothetical protein
MTAFTLHTVSDLAKPAANDCPSDPVCLGALRRLHVRSPDGRNDP